MVLRTTKEIADFLRVGEGAAKKLLKRWGVEPFRLGVGRGKGDRWDLNEVEEAMKSLRAPEPKESPKKPRRTAAGYFDGSCPPRLTSNKAVQ